uniref:39S ribosomal protein L39, mitochondrial n=1 Tax=Steinernema glaseri TaxID=37863 RepID=A0A1I7YK14_9BILA
MMLPKKTLTTIAASSAAGRRMLSGLTSSSARRRLQMFQEEKARQEGERKATLGKIVVSTVNAEGNPVELLMNKNLSTGYDCAKQISHFCAQNSALCVRNNVEVIGMNEVLKEECDIDFLDFVKPRLSNEVNDAYWRSCSLTLGAVVQSSFRNEVTPGVSVLPDVKSGRFLFDANIKGLKNWEATPEDLKILTKRVRSAIVEPQYKFDLLRVPVQFAEELLGSERIAAEPKLDIDDAGDIALYCVGGHVDITNGPCIPTTGLIGKFEVAAIEQIGDETYRFKGVSLPRVQQASSYTWNILVNTAAGRKSEVEASKRVATA